MKNKNIFYTKKGDKGFSEIANKKIKKTSLIIKTLGGLDELNSYIGVARNQIKSKNIKKILKEIQEDLFIIQANLAYFMYKKFSPPEFKKHKIKRIEKIIDSIEKRIEVQKKFIIPGSNKDSAYLDYLRAKTRTTEIAIFELKEKYKDLKEEILAYINRLSSLFYALAREQAYIKKIKEDSPKYK